MRLWVRFVHGPVSGMALLHVGGPPGCPRSVASLEALRCLAPSLGARLLCSAKPSPTQGLASSGHLEVRIVALKEGTMGEAPSKKSGRA